MEDLEYSPKVLREVFNITKITPAIKKKYGLSKKDSNFALYKILNDKLLAKWESDSDSSSDYVDSD